MLGRQAVVDRDQREPGPGHDLGADIVVAVEVAEHEAAAVQIEH